MRHLAQMQMIVTIVWCNAWGAKSSMLHDYA
jgi:hypothetical protein